MLKVISLGLLLAQTLFPTVAPGVTTSDAAARAGGNDKRLAIAVGERLFRTLWPAQVLSVYADSVGTHAVVGLRISGEHFHGPVTQRSIDGEIADLSARAFSVSPAVEEVDAWLTVPLSAGKGIAVKSDVNVPSWSTVLSISILRGESRSSILSRLRSGSGVFVDQDWKRTALK